MSVAIFHGADDLLKESTSFRFVHLNVKNGIESNARSSNITLETYLALLDNVVEELASGVLDHHDNVCRRSNHLISGVREEVKEAQ